MIIFLYQPVSFSDTPSYRRLANAVLSGFTHYDGTRTPGYPIFLALLGRDQNVWIAQLLLGFATTILLFYIGWKFTDKPWFGGLIGLLHTLNLGQLFFESNLLTETLTTFLIVLSLAGMVIWLINPQKRSLWLAFLIGFISVCILLVRPLFIYFPFLLGIFLWIGIKLQTPPSKVTGPMSGEVENSPTFLSKHPSIYIIAFIVPVILILGSWITFIHNHYGDWSLTTMTGFHLIQHTGSYFEYVPDEYAALRDTYLQYRDAHIAQFGTQTNTIWEAIPEMSHNSGYNFYDLSRVLTKISIRLILDHPFLFLKSAISGWWMFWRPSFYWSAEALRHSWLASGIKIAIQIERILLFAVNLFFIISSIYYFVIESFAALRHKPLQGNLRFSHPAKHAYFWLIMATIWIASILQTLLDHGDNPRFLVPLQSLVILWVALFLYQLLSSMTSTKYSTPDVM